jgi:type IV pilus assembly protein PilX
MTRRIRTDNCPRRARWSPSPALDLRVPGSPRPIGKAATPVSAQEGVALVVSLVFLVLVTLLVLGGARTANLEEKMTANAYDRNLAFQAAEAALREAEKYVADNKPAPSGTTCSNGICPPPDNGATPRWEDSSFNAAWKSATVSLGTLAGTAPQYLVEYLGSTFPCRDGGASDPKNCKRYRTTARSSPSTDRATVTLQSVYATE